MPTILFGFNLFYFSTLSVSLLRDMEGKKKNERDQAPFISRLEDQVCQAWHKRSKSLE